MKRSDVMEIVARYRNGAPAITGPGATSGTFWAAAHEPATIYNMEMGYATPMCLGVALALPAQKVIALEGEGSAILGMPALVTIGRYQPPNLVVIIFDNKLYGTGGGEVETGTATGTDLRAVATACGIKHAESVTDVEQAEEMIRRALAEPGPWVLVAEIEATDTTKRPVPDVDHVEAASAFRSELAQRR